ncbi:hypothetical protein ACOMHN_061210 [Nucella lapillus]
MATSVTAGSSANASTVGYSLTDFSDGPQQYSQPWDISDPFMSASTRDLLRRMLKCYIQQPIIFVGIPGNVLCCAVFLKQGLSDRINLLLFWLAVADLNNLMTQLMMMYDCYLVDPVLLTTMGAVYTTYIGPLTWWLAFASGAVTLLLSVDRCLSVALPFQAKRLLQYRLTVAAISVSYLLPLTFSLFNYMAYTLRWRTDLSTNRSVAYMAPTTWLPMENKLAFDLKAYFSAITGPVFLVVMIVCCTITIMHLRRASQSRVKMSGNMTEEAKSGENRINVMLMQRPCSLASITIAAGRSTHCPGTLAFLTAAAGWSTQRCPWTLALIIDIAAVS